jgi:hypothetical protein
MKHPGCGRQAGVNEEDETSYSKVYNANGGAIARWCARRLEIRCLVSYRSDGTRSEPAYAAVASFFIAAAFALTADF